jgi:hypothetical protein
MRLTQIFLWITLPLCGLCTRADAAPHTHTAQEATP